MVSNNTRRNIPKSATSTQTGQIVGQLNNGVRVAAETALKDLSDVHIRNLGKNEILFYDGDSKLWVNKEISDAMNVHVWILDGGNVQGYSGDEPGPTPPEPGYNTYAEELTYVLYNFLNSEVFQRYIQTVDGLESLVMEGSTINLVVSHKFKSIVEKIYDDDDVSRMMGRIVTSIYDNISGDIRSTMDEIETDLWLNCKCQNTGDSFEAKLFVYMSDSSVAFYNLKAVYPF